MSGTLTWAWLSIKLQRSEIVFAALLCVGLAAAALWLTADMRAVLTECGTPTAPEACNVIYAFQNTHGHAVQMIQMAIGFALYAVPLVLGVPILTREIEQKTAMIAWPMAGSRLRWLAWRFLPVLVIGLLLIGVMAFAAEQLAQAYLPRSDIGFQQHGTRGFSLVTRSMLMLVAAVLLGAVIGRVLPALLVAIALAVGLTGGLEAVPRSWFAPSELLAEEESPAFGANSLTTDLRFMSPDGRWMSDEEAEQLQMAVYGAAGGEEPDPALLPQEVFFGVPASRYPEVLVRESAALAAVTVAVGGLAVLVVQRRRPE